MSKNSMLNQKRNQSNAKKNEEFVDGTTNTTDNVEQEAPRTYSKVERAEVQAGVKDPSEIVGNSDNNKAVDEEFTTDEDATQARIEKVEEDATK